MELLLSVAAFLLVLVLCRVHGGVVSDHIDRSGRYRLAFLLASGVVLAVWTQLYVTGWVAGWSAVPVVLGALLGGVTATTRNTGLVENNAPPSEAARAQVLAYHRHLRQPREPAWKRPFDTLLALVGLIVTQPVWLMVALLIWFEEPGPVFFVKNSVGRAGVTFRQVKFRTMRSGCEATTGPVPSRPGDPRTLRVGRWLRRWHLDELPELINVLAGTMSLVGPRPLRTVQVQQYLEQVPGFAQRHTVRPGIACYAQIERYRMPPDERLRMDQAYIRRMSLRTDLALLFWAVVTTVRGERDRLEAADPQDGPGGTLTDPRAQRSAHAHQAPRRL